MSRRPLNRPPNRPSDRQSDRPRSDSTSGLVWMMLGVVVVIAFVALLFLHKGLG